MLVAVFVTAMFSASGQAQFGTMDDRERIAINPRIDEGSGLSGQAGNLMLSRMSNIINLNGMAAEEEKAFFAMVPKVSVISEDITTTAPPMHAVTLHISFTLTDNYAGNVYGETSVEVRGVDRSKERAYTQAIRSINPRAGQFRAFIQNGKDAILAFYNTNCDMVLSTAESLIKQDRKWEATQLLHAVPPVSRECHDLSMRLAGEIGPVTPPPQSRPEIIPLPEGETPSESDIRTTIDQTLFELSSAVITDDRRVIVTLTVTNLSHIDKNIGLPVRQRAVFYDEQGRRFSSSRVSIGDNHDSWGYLRHLFLSQTPTMVTYEFQDADPRLRRISLLHLEPSQMNGEILLRHIPVVPK